MITTKMIMSTGFKNKLGIIDSGAGGITVAHAILQKWPGLAMHYFADHKHLPYGLKSEQFLVARVSTISQHLIAHGCNQIVLACHTASAVLRYKNLNCAWLGVVQPTLQALAQLPAKSKVGIIGTPATINSNVYQNIGQLEIKALATPLLADLIEQQAHELIMAEINQIAKKLGQIDYLVLACTHYPLVTSYFKSVMSGCVILNTPDLTANTLAAKLGNYQGNSETIIIESSKPNTNFLNIAESVLGKIDYLESVL